MSVVSDAPPEVIALPTVPSAFIMLFVFMAVSNMLLAADWSCMVVKYVPGAPADVTIYEAPAVVIPVRVVLSVVKYVPGAPVDVTIYEAPAVVMPDTTVLFPEDYDARVVKYVPGAPVDVTIYEAPELDAPFKHLM